MGRSKQVSLLLGIVLLGLIVTISVSSAYAFLAPTFLFKIPSVPSGQFGGPVGVGVDSSDNIYVTDTFSTRTVQVFDKTGAFLLKIGPTFPGGSFSLPWDVAVDSTGRIIVVSCALIPIQVFDSSGGFLTTLGITSGSGVGQLRCPEAGITVDGLDNIYVADSGNHRIQVFDKTGTSQLIIGPFFPGGSLGYPVDVVIDSNGRIIVADLSTKQVQIFDSSGNFLNKFGGSPTFSFGPWGVAVDSSDNIYATDIDRNDIQIFDSSGNFIAKFGGSGSGDGQFFRDWDVAIDSNDRVIVTDQGNRRVQIFGSSDSTPPVITLNGDAIVTLLVGETYNDAGATASDDVDGDLTAAIVTGSTVDTSTAGTYAVTYDVSDSAGNAAVQVTRTVEVQSPAQATENLIDDITSLGLPEGVESSLTAPLQNVGDKLTDNNPNNDSAACGKLEGFINQVNAQEGKKLTSPEADELRQAAQAVKNSLGC